MGNKKVKISSAKRVKHIRGKKNVAPSKGKKKSLTTVKHGKQMKDVKGKLQNNKISRGHDQQSAKGKKKQKKKSQMSGMPEIHGDVSSDVDDIMDMIDDDDAPHLANNFTDESKMDKSKGRKRKNNTNNSLDGHEKKFREEYAETRGEQGKIRDLLPIKTKHGIIPQSMVLEDEEVDEDSPEEVEEPTEENDSEVNDSDDEIIRDRSSEVEVKTENTAVSVADLLTHREQEVQKQKYRIGIICSGILERPEERIKNFSSLFDLMGRVSKEGSANLISVRKVALLSALEVFKDIIPEYKLGVVETENVKLKKDTLLRVTFENILLQQYKKYLQILERITMTVSKKRPSGEGPLTDVQISLAQVATNCLCELILAHPNFNFSTNIGQTLVYLSNNRFPQIREKVNGCFRNIFKTDKRLELTLHIIRRINHLVKTKQNNVHCEVLTCLTSLYIKNINLDADKEKEIKEKKLEAKKSRVMNLSKKERKRQKKLKELEKELLETKAEENKESRQHKLTEITKLIFNIYFRILKNDPNSKLLATTLEGLAKFANVINMEFFSDLVNVLNNIMESVDLDYREQLHCIQTVFVMLSGQGEVLNIDPIRFYNHLYRNMLSVHAGKNHEDFLIILRTLTEVLVKRRKDVTYQRLLAFTKRVMTASLQLLHNGSLGCICVAKNMLQLTSKAVDVLLDTETFVGSGKYDPELPDPEYCNANCTLLYEVSALMRHYHPTCVKMAKHLASGAPISGEGSLNMDVAKLSPEELFEKFDSSAMTFNPAIPPPRMKDAKNAKGLFFFSNDTLRDQCSEALRKPIHASKSSEILDFHASLYKGISSRDK
ncbi:nucleolar complex protein 3 homolog [Lutzomyia longipalpis]|uniref:nucleolar complex protein 3 homolog n=1 Tax=Lutzomyia longipalpis TaxID=7200 RepID=UPI00248330CB|nr:nucleolar complex protein 3 homolog [Lutzomyia longipalpis]